MKSLSNSINTYFYKHFTELPLDKQFHFAVRLSAWTHDSKSSELLASLRPQLLPDNTPLHALQAIQSGKLIPLLPGNQHVLHLREEYNQRYPLLRAAARLLYWATMLDYAYGTDSHASVYEVIPQAELQQMYDALLEDRQAVAILSTHAVNFMYLYAKYCLGQYGPDAAGLFAIGKDDALYSADDPLHRQLRMYLLTHTLIADSMFYTEPLPNDRLAVYTEILTYLELLVAKHLDEISLDNKLEFLVCCRLADYSSTIESTIIREAEASVSNEGMFLVDTHNRSNSTYTSFEKSEHRTVLYLMACMQPHS
jgi:hypothetical protein